jgi:hypothetical protein
MSNTKNQEGNREILDSNDIVNKPDGADICRILHLTTTKGTFFSKAYKMFSRTNHF